jgi:hypothetical protein
VHTAVLPRPTHAVRRPDASRGRAKAEAVGNPRVFIEQPEAQRAVVTWCLAAGVDDDPLTTISMALRAAVPLGSLAGITRSHGREDAGLAETRRPSQGDW